MFWIKPKVNLFIALLSPLLRWFHGLPGQIMKRIKGTLRWPQVYHKATQGIPQCTLCRTAIPPGLGDHGCCWITETLFCSFSVSCLFSGFCWFHIKLAFCFSSFPSVHLTFSLSYNQAGWACLVVVQRRVLKPDLLQNCWFVPYVWLWWLGQFLDQSFVAQSGSGAKRHDMWF